MYNSNHHLLEARKKLPNNTVKVHYLSKIMEIYKICNTCNINIIIIIYYIM